MKSCDAVPEPALYGAHLKRYASTARVDVPAYLKGGETNVDNR